MIRPLLISILFPYTTLFRSIFDANTARDTGRADRALANGYPGGSAEAAQFSGSGSLLLDGRPVHEYPLAVLRRDRKSTRLNSSHPSISYAVFCLKKKQTYTK